MWEMVGSLKFWNLLSNFIFFEWGARLGGEAGDKGLYAAFKSDFHYQKTPFTLKAHITFLT